VVLVVLPVLLQLRRGLAGETSLVEVALDRAPDLPAIEHRRALVVEQRRVLDHYAQQMQPLVLAEEILPACALVAGSCASRVRAVPGRHHRVPPRPSRPSGTLFSRRLSPWTHDSATRAVDSCQAFVSTNAKRAAKSAPMRRFFAATHSRVAPRGQRSRAWTRLTRPLGFRGAGGSEERKRRRAGGRGVIEDPRVGGAAALDLTQ